MDSLLLSRSFGYSEVLLAAPDLANPGSPLFLHASTWLEISLMASSMARVDSSLFALDFLHLDPSPSSQAYSRSGFVSSVAGRACLGVPVFALGFVGFESLVFLRSPACLDSAFPVLDFAHFGSPSMLRSSSRCGPLVLPSDFACLGSMSLARSFVKAGSCLSSLDFCFGGSSPPLRSLSWLGAFMSASDFVHVSVLPLLRSSA